MWQQERTPVQTNIRINGIALMAICAIAAIAAAGWFTYSKYLPGAASTIETSLVAPEVPVVMRTAGGLLEIAAVKVYERFTRSDRKEFWGIDLGTTVSQIQVPVLYRYHIALEKEWPVSIRGKTALVNAGAVKASLPVAFDTAAMEKQTQSGWARFNKDENLALLERSITPQLQERAQSDRYRLLAIEAGRQTVAEFVTTWLLKEQKWKRDPEYQVIVLFPGESLPSQRSLQKAIEAQH
jgi:hypothetical protein